MSPRITASRRDVAEYYSEMSLAICRRVKQWFVAVQQQDVAEYHGEMYHGKMLPAVCCRPYVAGRILLAIYCQVKHWFVAVQRRYVAEYLGEMLLSIMARCCRVPQQYVTEYHGEMLLRYSRVSQ